MTRKSVVLNFTYILIKKKQNKTPKQFQSFKITYNVISENKEENLQSEYTY